MSQQELEQPLSSKVASELTSRKVFVRCNVGTLPLEWPKDEQGRRMVSDCDLIPMGNKVIRANERIYRNIETTITNDQGVGAQSAGVMVLDLLDKSHPTETDAEFLARIEDWIENSGDPRIEAKGVRIEKGNPFPVPFARWDEIKPKALAQMVANMLGDDYEENLAQLKAYAQYELSKDEPRQAVLDILDKLAQAPGDESADEAPEDAS